MPIFRRNRKLSDIRAQPPLATLRKVVRILVVDDDPNSFPIKTLQSEGYNIEHWPKVTNVNRLESGDFDIIILDIVGVASEWSAGDGLGILEHLKKRNPSQIVIAFSGHTFDLSKTSFWKLADETLPKPVDALKCKQVVDNLIETTFTIQHYWHGIVQLLRGTGVHEKKIEQLEDQVASAITKGTQYNYAEGFSRFFKAGELLVTLVSIGEKINQLSAFLK